ncbi:damage repair protein [Bacillus pseudomycoides]|nr:damage repair protein [Bacillus pseudomycoides]PHE69930.1 damage repair protein [Bacillus pseudomycoides]
MVYEILTTEDLCSFFASCACVMRGLDPLKVKLAVVGDVSRNGSIVLAATPELKKLGISTATRFYIAVFLS